MKLLILTNLYRKSLGVYFTLPYEPSFEDIVANRLASNLSSTDFAEHVSGHSEEAENTKITLIMKLKAGFKNLTTKWRGK